MACSLDLRTRLVDGVDRDVGTISEIATLFGVHESSIYKLLRQRLGRGDIAALLHGGGAQAKLNGDQLMILANLVAASPDAPLERAKFEMRQKTLPVEKLVFVDEFGANIAMPPLTPDLHKESAQKSASRSTRWAASRPPAL